MAIYKRLPDVEYESVVLKADRPVLVDFWPPGAGPAA